MRVVALKNIQGVCEDKPYNVSWGTYGTCSESFEYLGERYILVRFDNGDFLVFGAADHPLIPYRGWIRIVED